MKQVLDKPGSCGQYENYERPEGFPVGKRRNLLKMDISPLHRPHTSLKTPRKIHIVYKMYYKQK